MSGDSTPHENHTAAIRDVRTIASIVPPAKTTDYIYDAKNTSRLPGVIDNNPARSSDVAHVEAFNWTEATIALYRDIYSYKLLDGIGSRLTSTVHYLRGYANAFWNGSQMVYGDGDGKIFHRLTMTEDICGHELTHGVVNNTCALVYQGQAGALNEHIADVFGTLVKQRRRGNTVRNADWVIGKGIVVGNPQFGIRSLKAPGTAYVNHRIIGTDPQPAIMSKYVDTQDDNGGVHINSGIPNHAFYLACMAQGDRSWLTIGRIWFNTAFVKKNGSYRITPNCQFIEFAHATLSTAFDLYGYTKPFFSVRDAWISVQVLPPGTYMP